MELDISKKEGTEKTVYAGTGISKDNDPYKAGKEAVKMAIDKCGAKPDFGIVFCSGGKYGKNDRTMKKLVKGAHEAFTSVNPDCKWFGCTSAGEISNYGFTSESCVAIAIKSEFIHVGIGVGRNTHNKPKEAGEDAINHALKSIHVDKYVEPYVRYMAEKKLPVSELVKMKPYTVMMLNSGFTTEKRGNEDDIVEGITKVIGHRIPILGGSSADDFNLQKTYVFENGHFYRESVVCAIISSSINFGNSVAHGYVPTDKSMFVNKAEDYIVYELDNKPAFDRYAELVRKSKREIWPHTMKIKKLGPICTAFMGFAKNIGVDIMKLSPIIDMNCNTPLALAEYKPYVKGRFWIKAIDSVKKDKYLEFTEKVPQGTALYFMKTDKEKSLNAGLNSITDCLDQVDNEASFSLIFYCALHRWFLGHHAEHSVDLIRKKLHDIPYIGFHAYGEILDGKHTLSIVSLTAGKKLISG